MNPVPVTGLILAAGASSRMGYPKARLTVNGQTYLERIYQALLEGGCTRVYVVTGAHHSKMIGHMPQGIRCVHNPQWHRGMRSSLRVGLNAVGDGATLLTHIDRPGLKKATVTALIENAGARPVIPLYRGEAGHPVLLPVWMRPLLLKNDDAPLRDILRRCAPRTLNVQDRGILLNINTPQDHAIFRAMAHKTASHACIERRSV